jgi:secreted trypsin-like serine protease
LRHLAKGFNCYRHDAVKLKLLELRLALKRLMCVSIPLTYPPRQTHFLTKMQASFTRILQTLAASAVFWPEVNAIINGELKNPASPYIVSLVISGPFGDTHVCGGTIIGAHTVLTAAHCTARFAGPDLRVNYGGTDRTTLPKSIPVTEIIQHPAFNPSTSDSDFAVLHLAEAVTQPDGAPMTNYAHLSTQSPPTGLDIVMSGWGLNQGDGPPDLPNQLYAATLQSLENAACNGKWSDVRQITPTMACAESTSKSFCRGDDGGPAMDAIGAVVYGVMSWNADGCPADTTMRPNVYAEVSSVRDWIVQNSV